MQSSTIKTAFLVLILASSVGLAACDDDNNSTTQPGPSVSTPTSPTPAPTPTPEPTPTPTPTPTPQPPSDQPPATETLTGTVANLNRGGTNDLDIEFRIDDFTIVKAASGTPVISGSQTFNTDGVQNGQRVTVVGTRSSGDSRGSFLNATRITIDAPAP